MNDDSGLGRPPSIGCARAHRPLAEAGFGRVGGGRGLATGEVDHAEVAGPAAFGRLAQRAGRQESRIAVAATAIDDLDLDIARQAVVLQSVVADDDVATGLDQRARGGDPVAVDAHLRHGPPREQQWLVAHQ